MTRTEFNPAKLGVFLIGGLALGVMAFILWGPLSDLWQKRYVVFFDEVATGLDAGSPVRLNGVSIGKVESIDLFFDQAQTNKVYTAVVVQLDPHKVNSISKGGLGFDAMLTNKEVSAMLGVSGLVSMTLEVDLKIEPHPLKPGEYHTWDEASYASYFGKHPWIPARQSMIAKVMEKLGDVLDDEALPSIIGSLGALISTNNSNGLVFKVSAAADNLYALTKTMNTMLAVNTNGIHTVVSNFAQFSADVGPKLGTLVSNLSNASISAQTNLDKFGAGVEFITNSLPGILTNLDALSAEMSVVLRGAAPVPPQAVETLRSLQDTSESLHRLVDFVERHPESLLRGRAKEK